ncbi:hypothetical protein OIV83_001216 [Microbotryomycetes sp. JL201]|nr:hypothetical protein OIV83_001216 [Microbotryomycetes sp. JL201]
MSSLLVLLDQFANDRPIAPGKPSGTIQRQFIYLVVLSAILSLLSSSHQNTNVKVLASQQSVTGRIVTAETESRGMRFRYLRSDHSLLGGLWVGPAEDEIRRESRSGSTETEIQHFVLQKAESIYSTFILQEAVTLIERPRSQHERALVIGVGAGMIVRALEARQINVTAIEIDPVVHEHARRWFGLGAASGGVHLEDARTYLSRGTSEEFDYIIHDVFTGGALPSKLFTKECWQDVKSVMTREGIVAINFAGDTTSASAKAIFATIADSFRHCRAFEDGEHATSYRNIVIFCSNVRSIHFRPPLHHDLLSTVSPHLRQRVFAEFEKKEVDLHFSSQNDLIADANADGIAASMKTDVAQHWHLMQGVLSSGVWAKLLGLPLLAAIWLFSLLGKAASKTLMASQSAPRLIKSLACRNGDRSLVDRRVPTSSANLTLQALTDTNLAHYHSGTKEPVWPGSLGGWTLAALSAFVIALFTSSLFLVGILIQEFWSTFWLNLAVWLPLFILFLITAIGIDVANDNNETDREGMFATVEAFVWMECHLSPACFKDDSLGINR